MAGETEHCDNKEMAMTVLKNYRHFDGRHWETGSVHNVLAYQGVKAPHSGQPLSEAMLLGISGGIAFGYFVFEYKGYDPHVVLLTRNTFDPLQTLLERLGVVQTVLQTGDPAKGDANLMEVLEGGRPAIVWADVFSLPHNALAYDAKNWAMFPVVVFGHDGRQAYVADRSSQPFTVAAGDFARARARVKQDKLRVVSLDPPDMHKLPAAVQKGLWQCIRLFTEAPPRGTRNNFGLTGLKHWAKMLTNTRNAQCWARLFAPGRRLWAALAGSGPHPGVFGWIQAWGDGGAERGRYADFLDEAAALLKKPGLKAAAAHFRHSQAAWKELSGLALPAEVRAFKEAHDMLTRRETLFIEKGEAALQDIKRLDAQLGRLREAASEKFPLTNDEAAGLRERMSAGVLKIHAIESQAVEAMQAAIA
jgi:hypothetical protein